MKSSSYPRALLLIAALHTRASAQPVAVDKGAIPEHRSYGSGLWLSAGAGLSNAPSNAAAGRVSLSYASGALVVVGRGAGATDIDGNSVGDMALLVGVRSAGPVFGTAAFGPARSHWTRYCGFRSCQNPSGNAAAVGFDFGMHATWIAAGLGLNVFGTAGPGNATYMAFGLSLDLGWFGRWQ